MDGQAVCVVVFSGSSVLVVAVFSLRSQLSNLKFLLCWCTITDEYGRPFIILREQQAKARVKGLEAVRVSIMTLLKHGSNDKGKTHFYFAPFSEC